MKSLKELYRIGIGPSSSHTMGPRRAAEIFSERNIAAASFEVTLYGSLAATGRGHLTDKTILDVLEPIAPTSIVWQPEIVLPFHTNGMKFRALAPDGTSTDEWTVYSIGGGALAEADGCGTSTPDVYSLNSIADIMQWCSK
ncbi:MAG: serine dehydratase, partial [Bacteroidales bacterium]|nr:serine dehydratase [Bacteroidales bacterium]